MKCIRCAVVWLLGGLASFALASLALASLALASFALASLALASAVTAQPLDIPLSDVPQSSNVWTVREDIVLGIGLLAAHSDEKEIRYGDLISLQSHHGRFLVAEQDGRLNANRRQAREWEQFRLVDPANPASGEPIRFGDQLALFSHHSRWVVGEPDGDAHADRDQLGNWEIWTVVDPRQPGSTGGPVLARHLVAMRSLHERYLVAEGNDEANANRSSIGAWETWRIGTSWSDFYYDRAEGCGSGQCCPCPYRGQFDNANCFIAKPPKGEQALQSADGQHSYQPATAGDCPLGSWDGSHCIVGNNPPNSKPFVHENSFYLSSTCTGSGQLTARLERVAHCSGGSCDHQLTKSGFSPWQSNQVPELTQRRTVLGTLFSAPKAEVTRVGLILPGQQFELDNGSKTALTGQPDKWLKGWGHEQASQDFVLHSKSLPVRLQQEGLFAPENSFLAVAFDARFNHEFSAADKDKIEAAYYQWLRSHFDPNQVELIYLAGYDRGGCLAMRLAKRFRAELPQVDVVVQSFDGVCNRNQGELGLDILKAKAKNPLASSNSVYAWPINLRQQFQEPEDSLAVLLHVGGHSFLPGDLLVRPFSQEHAEEELLDLCWLKQRWLDQQHYLFAGLSSVTPAVEHLKESLQRFEQGPACPQSGQCAKRPDKIFVPFQCRDLQPADCLLQSECKETVCRHRSGSLTCKDLKDSSTCNRYSRWCKWKKRKGCRKKPFVLAPFECNDLNLSDCQQQGECRVDVGCRKDGIAGSLECKDFLNQESCNRYSNWCRWE
ncbi:MAG: hypothetical protein AAGD01_19375 [Acidobacteriota bacterium]